MKWSNGTFILVLSIMVLVLAWGFISALGESYRSFRIYYNSRTIEAYVTSCKIKEYDLSTPDNQIKVNTIFVTLRGKDFNETATWPANECVPNGTKYTILINDSMKDFRVLHSNSFLGQQAYEVGGFIPFTTASLVLLILIALALRHFVRLVGKVFKLLVNEINERILKEPKPKILVKYHRLLLITINSVPLIIGLILNILLFLYGAKLLLITSNINSFLCGLSLLALITYLIFLSPYTLYLLYRVNNESNL